MSTGGKEEKLEFVLLPAGTGNSGRLSINCKAITLEIIVIWCYMDYVANLLNESLYFLSFSFFFFLFFFLGGGKVN